MCDREISLGRCPLCCTCLIVTEGRKGSWSGRGRCAVERACASALHHRAAISTTRRGITASSVVYSVEERDDAEVA